MAGLRVVRPADLADSLAADFEALFESELRLVHTMRTNLDRSSEGKATYATVRHELRTPLNAMRGYTELLLEDIGAVEIRTLLSALLAATDRLIQTIDEHLGESAQAVEEVEQVRPFQPVQSATILVVDDNSDNLTVLTRRLSRDGHRTVTASDGASALALMRREDFDVVLLDFQMPDMDGAAVLAEMKADEHLRNLPVVMLSAGMDLNSIVRCIELGAEDYVPKPFNPVLLRARIGASLEKKRLREREKASWEQRLRGIMELVVDGLALVGAGGLIEAINPIGEAIFGHPPDALLGRPVIELFPADERASDRAGALADWLDQAQRDVGTTRETEGRRANGDVFAMEVSIKEVRQNDRQLFVLALRDITERKAAEARTAYLARYDSLTSLPNRAMFQEWLGQYGGLESSRQRPGGLFVFGIASDRELDDTLGLGADDLMLRSAAVRLRGLLRRTDMLSRLDGSEFAVLRPHLDRGESLGELAETVIGAFTAPLDVDGSEVSLAINAGFVPIPQAGLQAEELLRRAGLAMGRARAEGPGSIAEFAPGMLDAARRRKLLERHLRAGIADRVFELHYQPKIDLASGDTVGLEALLRWSNPELGQISPAEFVPVAEASGLILPLGDWVIRNACRQLAEWKANGGECLPVAVNVSGAQFRRNVVVETVRQALAETGLDPSFLEIEITESALMHDAENARQLLFALRDLGVAVTIDDFGTGYSSLSYLQRFPLNKLKIDKSFISDVTDSLQARAIANTIVTLAEHLGLVSIAEGVETDDQEDFLRRIGCRQAQGFIYSPAIPPAQLESFLEVR